MGPVGTGDWGLGLKLDNKIEFSWNLYDVMEMGMGMEMDTKNVIFNLYVSCVNGPYAYVNYSKLFWFRLDGILMILR